jgi:hypothetical protein
MKTPREYVTGPWGFMGTNKFGFAVNHGGQEGHFIAEPDLLEALEKLVLWSEDVPTNLDEDRMIDRAREVITKAKGG